MYSYTSIGRRPRVPLNGLQADDVLREDSIVTLSLRHLVGGSIARFVGRDLGQNIKVTNSSKDEDPPRSPLSDVGFVDAPPKTNS